MIPRQEISSHQTMHQYSQNHTCNPSVTSQWDVEHVIGIMFLSVSKSCWYLYLTVLEALLSFCWNLRALRSLDFLRADNYVGYLVDERRLFINSVLKFYWIGTYQKKNYWIDARIKILLCCYIWTLGKKKIVRLPVQWACWENV